MGGVELGQAWVTRVTSEPDESPSVIGFADFEARCAAEPPPDDGWQYWNILLPSTAPRYFLWMIQRLLHDLRAMHKTP